MDLSWCERILQGSLHGVVDMLNVIVPLVLLMLLLFLVDLLLLTMLRISAQMPIVALSLQLLLLRMKMNRTVTVIVPHLNYLCTTVATAATSSTAAVTAHGMAVASRTVVDVVTIGKRQRRRMCTAAVAVTDVGAVVVVNVDVAVDMAHALCRNTMQHAWMCLEFAQLLFFMKALLLQPLLCLLFKKALAWLQSILQLVL